MFFLSLENVNTRYDSANNRFTSITFKTDDFVPVFAINRPIINKPIIYKNDILDDRFRAQLKDDKIPLYKYLLSCYRSTTVEHFKDYIKVIELYRSAVNDYINEEVKELKLPYCYSYARSRTYNNTSINTKTKNTWLSNSIKYRRFLSNLWFIGEADRNDITTPLMCLVVKRECLQYVRLCSLLGEEPVDYSIFELWVHDCLYSNPFYKNLKAFINKEFIKQSKQLGIDVVIKRDLNDLLSIPSVPKFKTISDRKTWISDQEQELLEHLKVSNQLKLNNIEVY